MIPVIRVFFFFWVILFELLILWLLGVLRILVVPFVPAR